MFYQRVCNSTDSGVFQNHYQDIGLHQKNWAFATGLSFLNLTIIGLTEFNLTGTPFSNLAVSMSRDILKSPNTTQNCPPFSVLISRS